MGREKSSKKGGQNASSTPKNDIVELGLEEAIDLIGKKNTKLVWLGSDSRVSEVVKSYSPINSKGGNFKFFKIGNMNFFHGNLEKSEVIEKIGYFYVKTVNKINYKIAPSMLAFMSRLYFGVKQSDYMFLGHLHYLGILKNNVFCGTLNHKFMPFPNSLGYVTLLHKDFRVVPRSIKINRVQ